MQMEQKILEERVEEILKGSIKGAMEATRCKREPAWGVFDCGLSGHDFFYSGEDNDEDAL